MSRLLSEQLKVVRWRHKPVRSGIRPLQTQKPIKDCDRQPTEFGHETMLRIDWHRTLEARFGDAALLLFPKLFPSSRRRYRIRLKRSAYPARYPLSKDNSPDHVEWWILELFHSLRTTSQS